MCIAINLTNSTTLYTMWTKCSKGTTMNIVCVMYYFLPDPGECTTDGVPDRF